MMNGPEYCTVTPSLPLPLVPLFRPEGLDLIKRVRPTEEKLIASRGRLLCLHPPLFLPHFSLLRPAVASQPGRKRMRKVSFRDRNIPLILDCLLGRSVGGRVERRGGGGVGLEAQGD